jgi:hypothetical protein
MRNDLLAAIAVIVALLIGYWLFHGGVGRRVVDRASATLGRPDQQMREDFAKAAGSIKVSVAEVYVSNGKMPADNAAAGLFEPDAYRGKTLQSATVHSDGTIDFVFDARSGRDGGVVRLVPDLSHPAMGVQWDCESSDYPSIASLIPNCTYTGK